jgi:L-alanine-DL-glutamate epimerase-like enolase superfamily enzyme
VIRDAVPVRDVRVAAYTIPTDQPEADGTLEWDSTTLVLVEVEAGAVTGIGYTYADTATATLIRDRLAQLIVGRDAFDNMALWRAMVRSIRNLGRPGIASMAIAGVDNALWDLKAKLLEIPLVTLLGAARDARSTAAAGSRPTTITPWRGSSRTGSNRASPWSR